MALIVKEYRFYAAWHWSCRLIMLAVKENERACELTHIHSDSERSHTTHNQPTCLCNSTSQTHQIVKWAWSAPRFYLWCCRSNYLILSHWLAFIIATADFVTSLSVSCSVLISEASVEIVGFEGRPRVHGILVSSNEEFVLERLELVWQTALAD